MFDLFKMNKYTATAYITGSNPVVEEVITTTEDSTVDDKKYISPVVRIEKESKEKNVKEISKNDETKSKKFEAEKKEPEKIVIYRKPEKQEINVTKETDVEKVEVVEEVNGEKVEVIEDKVAMSQRTTCPVKVIPVKRTNPVNVNVVKPSINVDDTTVAQLHEKLHSLGIRYNYIEKKPTGLIEVGIVQVTGNEVIISVDGDGILFFDEPKFYIGKINVGDEYEKPAIIFNDTTIMSVVNNKQIDPKFYVPENYFLMNKLLDINTLKEKDKKIREQVLEKARKAIIDEDVYDAILKASGGRSFRFAFSKYNGIDDFEMISSNRNLVSNLSDEKLLVDNKLRITIKGKDVKFTAK